MSHNITSTFTEDSYWFGSKQSYQRNSYRGQNQVQRNSYNQNRSKAKSFVSDNKSPNDDSPLPDVTYKLKFEDLDIDPINVILDSGADTNLIATDLAKELGLMVFPYPQKFLGLGGEGDSTIANGFTKMFIKLLPNHNCMSLKIYVFDNLPHKLILGTNFLYQAEINFQFNKDKSCRVLRHGKPLIASAIVPGIRVWGVWFDVYFDENFGANTFWSVYKEKMKEIFLNQRNKDKDEDASGDTSNESAVWNRIVEQHLTGLNY